MLTDHRNSRWRRGRTCRMRSRVLASCSRPRTPESPIQRGSLNRTATGEPCDVHLGLAGGTVLIWRGTCPGAQNPAGGKARLWPTAAEAATTALHSTLARPALRQWVVSRPHPTL